MQVLKERQLVLCANRIDDAIQEEGRALRVWVDEECSLHGPSRVQEGSVSMQSLTDKLVEQQQVCKAVVAGLLVM